MAASMRPQVLAAWPDILARLAAGDLIKDILRDHGLTRAAISAHILSDPVARALWNEAREASADSFFDEVLEVSRDPHVELDAADGTKVKVRRDPHATRLLADSLKWAARIRNPRLYSDKSTIDVNVRQIDLTRIISDANARLAAQRQGRIIDAEIVSNNSGASGAIAYAQSGESELAGTLDPALLALL